jgi:hypothetical protein
MCTEHDFLASKEEDMRLTARRRDEVFRIRHAPTPSGRFESVPSVALLRHHARSRFPFCQQRVPILERKKGGQIVKPQPSCLPIWEASCAPTSNAEIAGNCYVSCETGIFPQSVDSRFLLGIYEFQMSRTILQVLKKKYGCLSKMHKTVGVHVFHVFFHAKWTKRLRARNCQNRNHSRIGRDGSVS